ncbi:MAG: hypothetical protein GC151_13955 [Betaproteobacteria bacterium]|nr:hypothetical protein [Betaproteobacteria bacterium]
MPVVVLELDLDTCANTFGVSPCTATGTECYNTFATCKDRPNFNRSTKTVKFCSRGTPIPPGETLRPYLVDITGAVTSIDIEKGFAARASLTARLTDEPDADIEMDPYVASRASAAQGTFWTRLLRRNPNYIGRTARVRRGYAVTPWDWDTFQDERYVIDRIAQGANGEISITLKDPTKLADRGKIPVPTDGKLLEQLKGVAATGLVQAATSTTIQFDPQADSNDDALNGFEVAILNSTGAGQRRTISDYDGATRTATISSAWAVAPDTTSTYEVGALSLTLTSGKGSQYPDPASTGKREFIRIGEEVIEYTAVSGDVLSWDSGENRAQFGTTRADHAKGEVVQLCRAWFDEPVTDVIVDLLEESDMPSAWIDTTGIAAIESEWYGEQFHVTACLSEPESATSLLEDLLPQISAVLWWEPGAQKVKMDVLLAKLASPPEWTDEATLIEGSVAVDTLDDLRLTYAAAFHGLTSATANRKEAKYYGFGEIAIDTDAESANEYGDRRTQVTFSRWFPEASAVAMRCYVGRLLVQRRDAPKRIRAQIDPKDHELAAADAVDVLTAQLVDDTGDPIATRCILTKWDDRGDRVNVELRTLPAGRTYGYIAPDGTADHPTDTVYAHISNDTPTMGDGSAPYLIL